MGDLYLSNGNDGNDFSLKVSYLAINSTGDLGNPFAYNTFGQTDQVGELRVYRDPGQDPTGSFTQNEMSKMLYAAAASGDGDDFGLTKHSYKIGATFNIGGNWAYDTTNGFMRGDNTTMRITTNGDTSFSVGMSQLSGLGSLALFSYVHLTWTQNTIAENTAPFTIEGTGSFPVIPGFDINNSKDLTAWNLQGHYSGTRSGGTGLQIGGSAVDPYTGSGYTFEPSKVTLSSIASVDNHSIPIDTSVGPGKSGTGNQFSYEITSNLDGTGDGTTGDFFFVSMSWAF